MEARRSRSLWVLLETIELFGKTLNRGNLSIGVLTVLQTERWSPLNDSHCISVLHGTDPTDRIDTDVAI